MAYHGEIGSGRLGLLAWRAVWRRHRPGRALVWLALACAGAALQAAPPRWDRARTYGDAGGGGDGSAGPAPGLRVVLFATPEGMRALWRRGPPAAAPVQLLTVGVADGKWVVDVSADADDGGRWSLAVDAQEIVATGPRGQVLRLKRVPDR